MRSRNLKPGFFKNELLAECDPLARILFEGKKAEEGGYQGMSAKDVPIDVAQEGRCKYR